ncbi:MAG: tRNA pseudouridine(38-40) synthase TruA [Chloroflexi bacterium]|nr:tRNA pseudouridine(38-40) synthase TruA [Chloroflexota bacterium]
MNSGPDNVARYKIILAYDGTGLSGSQRQATARTAQSELEEALRRLGWVGKSVLMAGRTDSGVHARGQVVTFDLQWKHEPEVLVRALNGNLPAEMAVSAAQIVRDDFHPRFDATSRLYCYRLYCHPSRDPLRERYAWRQWPDLDADGLKQAASFIPGKHDFAAFGTPPRPGSSSVRTVLKAEWHQQGDEWFFEVQADAFLYHMVRRLVFVQVAVGQGKFPASVVADMLADRLSAVPAGLAPANGLTLVEVTYPE